MNVERTGRIAAAIVLAGALGLPGQVRAQSGMVLPEGARIVFTLSDTLSTETNRQGDRFSGVVKRSVRAGDRILIPEGSVVRGTLTHVERAGRFKGRAKLGLRFDELELPDGTRVNLNASLTRLDAREEETVTEEGLVEGEGTVKRDLMKAGFGAGMGSWIGAIANGAKGLAIGAGSGAAAGAVLALVQRGRDAELVSGSVLGIQLDRALTIPVK